ncbi:MAG: TlpA disulfide reductase family protein [Bacteroidota bacterium]
MSRIATFILILFSSLILWNCNQELPGTTINGKFTGSENLQVFVDKVVFGKANAVIQKAEIDGSGAFSINFPEGLDPGIYNVRIGAKRISLILEAGDNKIDLNGDLSTMQNYNLDISGSPTSSVLANTMGKLISRQMSSNDVKNFVDTVSSPTLGSYVAFVSLNQNGAFLPIHKTALEKLEAQQSGSELATAYNTWVAQVDQLYQQQLMRERVKVGSPAPDIKLSSPSGKEYALSDLKGKVVLLDFWAAWCGPCRRENPNVVKVYNKYKDQGFTIFSVSLDGVDGRTAARLDANQKDKMVANQKQRWISAIAQDNLTWEYHVSDLKKWDCAPAKMYGVTSIPRAFMIDRDGIIVSTKVRGADQIEAELLKHI